MKFLLYFYLHLHIHLHKIENLCKIISIHTQYSFTHAQSLSIHLTPTFYIIFRFEFPFFLHLRLGTPDSRARTKATEH